MRNAAFFKNLKNSSYNYKDIKEFISDDLVNKLSSELSEFNYKGLILISGFVEPLLDKNIFNISYGLQ